MRSSLVLGLILAASACLTAEEHQRIVAVAWSDLDASPATLPPQPPAALRILVTDGEAALDGTTLLLRLGDDAPIAGMLISKSLSSTGPVTFTLRAGATPSRGEASRLAIMQAEQIEMLLHDDLGWGRSAPVGGAWWNRRLQRLDTLAGTSQPVHVDRGRGEDLDGLFDLLTGSSALADNLQLATVLTTDAAKVAAADIPVETVVGLEVVPVDWSVVPDADGVTTVDAPPDVLARTIPDDQHAVFMPDLSALFTALDDADVLAGKVLGAAGVPLDAGAAARLKRQLCLEDSALARQIGPLLTGPVAITGSDLNLAEGSDVAVLFAAHNPTALMAYIRARQAASGAPAVQGTAAGVPWFGVRAVDRSVSSYLVQLDDTVVVSTSAAQLERLIATQQGRVPALAASADYRHLRARTARSDRAASSNQEIAWILLPDAAIRRWCSPSWRIATARRSKALVRLTALAADHGQRVADPPPEQVGLGTLTIDGGAVRSSIYGRPGYLTPLIELAVTHITAEERDAYERFRDRYRDGFRRWFDPIALRVLRGKGSVRAELTVLPLTSGSELVRMARQLSAQPLSPRAADPHRSALMQIAVRLSQRLMREMGQQLPLRLDGSLSIALEPAETEAALPAEAQWESQLAQVPLVVAMGLEAPPADGWAQAITGMSQLIGGLAEPIDVGAGLYQVTTGSLPVYVLGRGTTLFVAVHQPSIDRLRRRLVDPASVGEGAQPESWRNGQIATLLTPAGVEALSTLFFIRAAPMLGAEMPEWPAQRAVRQSIALLNDVRAFHPETDAAAWCERSFGARPVDPLGAAYMWDETWRTYASPTYGHPDAPKPGPGLGGLVRGWDRLRSGLLLVPIGIEVEADGPVDAPVAVPVEVADGAETAEITPVPAMEGTESVAPAAAPPHQELESSQPAAYELRAIIEVELPK